MEATSKQTLHRQTAYPVMVAAADPLPRGHSFHKKVSHVNGMAYDGHDRNRQNQPQHTDSVGGGIMIRHYIWDFDGTLFNSYPPMTNAYLEALRYFGIEDSHDRVHGLMKISADTLVQDTRRRYGLGSAFLEKYRQCQQAHEDQFMKPFPHAAEVCEALRRKGGTHYLYTHRGTSAIMFLERFHMKKDFSDFVTGESGFPRKPDPTALRHLMQKHGMKPQTCLMIGDRDIDLMAGRNAGMHTCLFDPECRQPPIPEPLRNGPAGTGPLHDESACDEPAGNALAGNEFSDSPAPFRANRLPADLVIADFRELLRENLVL